MRKVAADAEGSGAFGDLPTLAKPCLVVARRGSRPELLAAVRKVAEVGAVARAVVLPVRTQHCLVVARPVLLPPPTPLR